MVIKDETSEGVTLELAPEEARQLIAGLETHLVDLGPAAAELERQLREAGVPAAAPPEPERPASSER